MHKKFITFVRINYLLMLSSAIDFALYVPNLISNAWYKQDNSIDVQFFKLLMAMSPNINSIKKYIEEHIEVVNSTIPESLYYDLHGKYQNNKELPYEERICLCWFPNDCFRGTNALQVALEIKDDNIAYETCQILLEKGAIFKNENTNASSHFVEPIFRILHRNNSMKLLCLASKYFVANIKKEVRVDVYTPAYYCVVNNKYEELKFLLENGLNVKIGRNIPAYELALEKNDQRFISMLTPYILTHNTGH